MEIEDYKKLTHFADFDETEDFIIIEDIATREIIYTNPAYANEAGVISTRIPTYDKRFVTITTFIKELEGRNVAIEVGKRILPVTSSTYNYDLRSVVSEIENDIRSEITADFFISDDGVSKHDSIIHRTIAKTMNYYDVKYAHLFVFDEDSQSEGTLHAYYRDGEKDEHFSKRSHFPSYWENGSKNFFQKGYSLICDDVEGFSPFDPSLTQALKSRNISTVIIIPFFAEDDLIGLFIIADPNEIDGKLDLFLADFATNSIGMMIYRGRLYQTMYFDDITGLPWSNVLDYFYPIFLKNNDDMPIVIFEFDFLHFSMISRVYGAETGNKIMKKAAAIIQSKFPKSLITRKNGSDYYIIVTTGIAENIAIECQRLSDEIASSFPSIMMTICYGIYQVKNKQESLETSLSKSALAHKIAKTDPFNRVKIFDDKMNHREEKFLYFNDHFSSSLKNEDFQIYIQPKYNLETNTYFGGEVLVRWLLGGSIISPVEFIPLFEANGLCYELDLYVLKKTCQTLAKWVKNNPETALPLSVNFSRVDFADPMIFERIYRTIEDANIPFSLVEIEITESAYADYEIQIISFLKKCKAAGIKVLMDDFGSGMSSFNSLKNINVDVIKLDYKFLSSEGDNKKKRKIIESIVSLVRSINTPIIVEGVETEAEASFFRSLGVRYVQGFLFGKPMKVEDFEQLSNKHVSFEMDPHDSKLMINDILDTKTNIHLLYDEMPCFCGIFRFDGKGVFPININKTMTKGVSNIGPIDGFMNNDMLIYLNPKIRKNMKEYLNGSQKEYVFSDPIDCTFYFGTASYVFTVSAMFLFKDEANSYYLLQAIERRYKNDDIEDLDPNLISEWMLSTKIQGCVIADEKNKILAYNDFISSYYPSIKKGSDFNSTFKIDIDTIRDHKRMYGEKDNKVFEVSLRKSFYENNPVKIALFTLLGDPSQHVTESENDGFAFYDRLLSSVSDLAFAYIEVNLDKDEFMMLSLLPEGKKQFGSSRLGVYSHQFREYLIGHASESDRPKLRKVLAIHNLIDATKSRTTHEVYYKVEKKKIFRRMLIRSYYDHGTNYASIFLSDATEIKMKEFDLLTGCMARNAGIQMMNGYFSDHPLDKMALVILDIDDFKGLNDTYGHPLGDKVLAEMQNTFARLPEEYQYGTRLGGDEFCLMIRKRSDDFSDEKVGEIIDEMVNRIGYEVGLNKEIHVSCGVAMVPENGITFETLYPVADAHLYEVKRKKKSKRIG
ncbi:MAG: EAL domain-containing protein [Bacilli bacterium]|nr:EAL domain-containing protein [Bacilli bacterium]